MPLINDIAATSRIFHFRRSETVGLLIEQVEPTGVDTMRYTSKAMINTTTLLEQVLSLPEHERARIAARLLESLDEEAQSDIDAAWAAEIERRCAAVDAGTLATSDWKDVRARIEREIFGR